MRVVVLLRGWRRTPGGSLDVERLGRYERLALKAATSLREAADQEVTVVALSAGNETDDEALAVARAQGADETVRIWDPILGDIDPLGIAQALAHAARLVRFDLVLAGFRSPDQRQGFMGPAVADLLQVPHLTAVQQVRWEAGAIEATRRCEVGDYVHRLTPPCLLTVAGGADPGAVEPLQRHQPRLLTLDDVGLEETHLRPRLLLKGTLVPTKPAGYVTAFVDDAATVVEHLMDVDALR